MEIRKILQKKKPAEADLNSTNRNPFLCSCDFSRGCSLSLGSGDCLSFRSRSRCLFVENC